MKNDPIGRAIADFYENGEAPDIEIQTNYTEGELLSPSFFFREIDEMPEIDKKALELCRGKVLDVGAAAGCHALELQKRGFEVVALEKSKQAAEVMTKRGIENVSCSDVFHFHEKGFQTILLLMNGTGIGSTLEGLKKLLLHLKNLLNRNGQIIIDSSDISYLFEEEDGSVWVDLTRKGYFGEMNYELKYKNEYATFNWLFTDFDTLTEIVRDIGLTCEKIMEGKHFDYLAQLKIYKK
jgi:SAM-dependent methyltransferase